MAESKSFTSRKMFRAVCQSMRWRLLLFLVILALGLLALLINTNFISYIHQSKYLTTEIFETEIAGPEYEHILLWTPWFGSKLWFFDGYGSAQFKGCPESRCFLTYNRSHFNTSPLVLFHSRDIDVNDIPDKHVDAQNFIFMSMESPVNTWIPLSESVKLNNMFSMTMTYMSTSDLVIQYGSTVRRANPQSLENYAKLKDKGILWYVSNCYTDDSQIRLNFVKDLRRYVDVDMFGMCGDPDPCQIDKKTRNGTCVTELKKRYHFYLAMENSLCKDYITEKFWISLKSDMIPIVMGASMEEYGKVAPPSSFIHVNQFSSVKELATHLMHLLQNDNAYNQYMAWKRDFTIRLKPYKPDIACQMCSLAHQRSRRRRFFSLKEWWNKERLCRKSW